MRIKFKRQPLQEKVSLVAGLTEVHSPNEILQNILLRGSKKKGEYFIAATDIESTIVSFFSKNQNISAENADFDFLVPAKRFLDIISQIEGEDVEIDIQKNNWVEIKLPSAQFKIPTLPGNQFPTIPSFPGNKNFKLPIHGIVNILPSLLKFSSAETVRRNLNGVLFDRFEEGKIRFVATNAHELAYFHMEIEGKADFEKVLISRKAIGEIVKAVRSSDRESGTGAELSIDEKKVFFRFGDTTVISTPVDQSFPDYLRVVPDTSSLEPIVVDKNKMLGAVKRVDIFCSEPKQMDLQFSSSSTKDANSAPLLSFKSAKGEMGEGSEAVPVEFKGEGDIEASFNPDFLMDSLNFLDGNTVRFWPGDGDGPAVFTLSDTKDFICLVMPIKP